MEKGTKMKKTCSLFTGLFVGALVSSALVLLLTPWSGEELQENIKDFANNFQEASNMIATSQTANFRTMYNSCYEAIYWCNLILEKIPQSDDATIKRVKA